MFKFKNKIISLANKFVKRTSWYKKLWGGAIDIYNLNNFNLQVVNTGSGSGVHDFNYSGLSIKGFNFALAPQSLQHDFEIIKNYFSYFNKGCTVLIPICPFSGMIVDYDKSHNFKYYPMLHPASIQNFDENERTHAYNMYRNPFSTAPIRCIKGILSSFHHSLINKIHYKENSLSIENSATTFISGWKKQFSLYDLSSKISQDHIKQLTLRKKELGNMLDFCLERQFNPVLVMPPMHPSLSRHFSESFIEQYVQPLIDEAKIRNISFLNYTNAPEFTDDSLYANAMFLNEIGSKKFTHAILKKLNII